MGKDYGYGRISTKRQSIDRQIRNILASYPNAIIFKEVFTGTKFYGRKELDKLLRVVRAGDRIIFDSVSRFARDADRGVALYFELYLFKTKYCLLSCLELYSTENSGRCGYVIICKAS